MSDFNRFFQYEQSYCDYCRNWALEFLLKRRIVGDSERMLNAKVGATAFRLLSRFIDFLFANAYSNIFYFVQPLLLISDIVRKL